MEQEQPSFKKSLNLWDSTMLVIGSMIGSGIFIVTADIARNLGSPFYIILTWLLSGLITLIAALSYGELAGMMPKAGGQYVYLSTAYNRVVGFLFGWTTFAVVQTGVIAAVAIAFARFTGVMFGFFDEINMLFTIGSFGVSSTQALAVSMILLLTYTNSLGVNGAKWLQSIFTSSKIIALFGLIIFGLITALVFRKSVLTWDSFMALPFSTTISKTTSAITTNPLHGLGLIVAIGLASVGSLFSSDAWNNITYTAGEVQNPKKNIPLSLFYGTLTVTVIYILANVVYVLLLPVNGSADGVSAFGRGLIHAQNDRVGTAAMEIMLGAASVAIMAVLIMISTFGCNNGLILSGGRIIYAMADDGMFFKKAAQLNKNGVPAYALWIQAFWACILCLSGSYGSLLDFCTFASLCFYIITVVGIFVLRKKMPNAERPYKAFGYPLVPALYVFLAGSIALILLIYKPMPSWIGIGIVLLGLPIYYLFLRKEK